MYAPPSNYNPPFYDPAGGLDHASYSDPSFGAPLSTIDQYVAPHSPYALNAGPEYAQLGPGQPGLGAGYPSMGPIPMGTSESSAAYGPGIPMESTAPSIAEQISNIGGGASYLRPNGGPTLINAPTLESAAAAAGESAPRWSLGGLVGDAGAGGLLGALKPSNIKAGFGEMGGPGALTTGGISLGGNLLGQALVGHTRVGTAPHTAGHAISGAATGFGLGGLAAAGLVGADVATGGAAIPIELGGAALGAALGLWGPKGSGKGAPQTGFGTDPDKNDLLINHIVGQETSSGNITPQSLNPLVNSYRLQMQIAGNDKTQQVAVQKQMLDSIVTAASSGATAQQTKASQLEQQASLSQLLQPYLRSNIQTGDAMKASERAISGSLPPSMRAVADLLGNQASSSAHQTAASMAASAQVGPGLQQLIEAINQQNAIQNRTNALSSTGSGASLSGLLSGSSSSTP